MNGRLLVLLAVRLLPHAAQDRWREELLGELASLPADERRRFAVGVLLRAGALRAATTPAHPGAFAASPWTCRVRLHHPFRAYSADDGTRHVRCSRCGLDRLPARAVAYPEIPWSGLG